MRGLHVSVAARCRYSASDKTSSCSEDQQRNEQGSHETNQQFHLELLLMVSGVAGWYGYWLADGSGLRVNQQRRGLNRASKSGLRRPCVRKTSAAPPANDAPGRSGSRTRRFAS